MGRSARFYGRLESLIEAVKEEREAAERRDSRYSAEQLQYILSELTRMGSAVAWEEPFHPSYPRLLADMWPPDDGLGRRLSELAADYDSVQMERKLRQSHIRRLFQKPKEKET